MPILLYQTGKVEVKYSSLADMVKTKGNKFSFIITERSLKLLEGNS
jgi:hypothetical protein